MFLDDEVAKVLNGGYYFKLADLKQSPSYQVYRYQDSVYVGEVVFGKREGRGFMLYKNGRRFEGHWKADKREGLGTEKYANGHIYNG